MRKQTPSKRSKSSKAHVSRNHWNHHRSIELVFLFSPTKHCQITNIPCQLALLVTNSLKQLQRQKYQPTKIEDNETTIRHTLLKTKQLYYWIPLVVSRIRRPREISAAEISEVAERFVATALAAEAAGWDGVQLHSAHGCLTQEFPVFSPTANEKLGVLPIKLKGVVWGSCRNLEPGYPRFHVQIPLSKIQVVGILNAGFPF